MHVHKDVLRLLFDIWCTFHFYRRISSSSIVLILLTDFSERRTCVQIAEYQFKIGSIWINFNNWLLFEYVFHIRDVIDQQITSKCYQLKWNAKIRAGARWMTGLYLFWFFLFGLTQFNWRFKNKQLQQMVASALLRKVLLQIVQSKSMCQCIISIPSSTAITIRIIVWDVCIVNFNVSDLGWKYS